MPEEQVQAQSAPAATAEVSEFESLMNKEFKPKSAEAKSAVKLAVQTLAEQALASSALISDNALKTIEAIIAEMEKLARQIEAVIRTVPGTTSAFAERVIGGYYLNIDPDRTQLARYGLMISDVQNMIASALGAEPVTTTVEGRERYNVSLRYPRDLRSDPQAIATQVLVPTADGGVVPLGQIAKVSLAQGPATIRTENSQLAVYIFVDLRDRDIGSYVADAQKAVALFREIGQTLDLLPTTIILIANPTRLDQQGDVRLTWSSTEAREVSIAAENDRGDPLPEFSPGEVPAEDVKGGSVVVRNVSGTMIFTATAKGPCSAAEAEAEVVFGSGVP